MSAAFFGIKDYIQLADSGAWSRLGAPAIALFATLFVGIILVVIYLGKSPVGTKTSKLSRKSKFLRRRCDDDEEVSPPRSNQERSTSDKKLRRLLQRFQRKSGVPFLVAVIQDPFEKHSNKNETDEVKEPEEMNTYESSLDYESDRVWASGTGYGCSFDNASSDMNEWDSQQSQSYEEFTRFLNQITTLLSQISREENMRRVIRRSCLILFLDEHLSGSSMSIMNKHYSFYAAVFSLLNAVANHRPELHSLFTMNIRLVGKTKINMWKTLNKLYDQAKQAATLSSFHLDEDAEEIAQHVIPTFENMKAKFDESGGLFFDVLADDDDEEETEEDSTDESSRTENEQDVSENDKEDAGKSTSDASVDEDDSKDLEISYVECMKDLQFDMVKSFENHKFSAQCEANGAPGRKLIRRLGSEFSDLAVSLPLTEESSIYLRVSESRMDMVKFLIIPADGTPYAGGCFVFDAYFPPNYPDGPPSVNLMTTGGGTVRFNPNLYEDGYVCLSLLGTWSGQSDGERWQPNISTFLQVVLSVQCLIFVPKPYYNEPGYESYSDMDEESERYSQDKRENTVRYAMVDALENPTPEFKDVILKHFYLSRERTMKNAKSWLGESHGLVTKLQVLLDGLEQPVVG